MSTLETLIDELKTKYSALCSAQDEENEFWCKPILSRNDIDNELPKLQSTLEKAHKEYEEAKKLVHDHRGSMV